MINSLNPHTASNYDNIFAHFLRLGKEVLAPILTAYFTWVFEKGIFPCTFKTAKVVPIFKTGNKNSANNYRPISLLPSLSKVLEKLIKILVSNFSINMTSCTITSMDLEQDIVFCIRY